MSSPPPPLPVGPQPAGDFSDEPGQAVRPRVVVPVPSLPAGIALRTFLRGQVPAGHPGERYDVSKAPDSRQGLRTNLPQGRADQGTPSAVARPGAAPQNPR